MKNLRNKIDQLGHLNEAIASLRLQADNLNADIKRSGITEGHGKEFWVDVITQDRNYLDQKAVKAKLSPQFIAAHTRHAQVTSIKVVRIEEVLEVA